MNSVPPDLIKYFSRKDVVLFVGAGLSVNAGLPGWLDLIKPLSDSIGAKLPSRDKDVSVEHLLTSAQYFENKFGRNNLIHKLIDDLDTTSKPPSVAHFLLTLLPTKTVFTTNYDDLLERAFRETRQSVDIIVSDFEYAYSKEKDVKIVKMCGDLTRPESLVVTKRDFNIYTETHKGLLEKLKIALETKTVLFLGYGIKDPFLNQIWDCISLQYGNHQRPGYAVLFDINSLELEDLRSRKIFPINLHANSKERNEIFINWLIELYNCLIIDIEPERVNNIKQFVQDEEVLNRLFRIKKDQKDKL